MEEFRERCIHGNYPAWCSLCNPTESPRNKLKREVSELTSIYNSCIFKDEWEDWTEDEINFVYDAFKDKKGIELKTVYEVGIQLCRTKNAVRWMWKHIFSKREDLHRGKEVIKFREKINADR